MNQYRHSPAIVEAYQWTGSTPETRRVVREWVTANIDERGDGLQIETSRGWMTLSPGDWILRGFQGNFWICEREMFSCIYELVLDKPVPQANVIPRRNYIQKMVPAALAIRNATVAVEEVGADPWLTDAVVLLGQAFEKVADYIDRMVADA